MLDHFIRGARGVKGVEVEKIYLSDIPIEYYSFENSKGVGPDEGKFGELIEKIKQARGLVIATPTYNFSVPAHLKNFIDRIRFIALDLGEKNRLGQPMGKLSYLSTYFLVSGGTPKWAERLLFFTFPPFWLRGVFLYFGAKVMGATYTGDIRSFENHALHLKCQKTGNKYARDVLAGRRHGLLEDIFWRPPQVK
jgi:putative NADPH-quinone reductase